MLREGERERDYTCAHQDRTLSNQKEKFVCVCNYENNLTLCKYLIDFI